MDEHNKTLYSSFGNFFAIFDWYLFLKVEALQNFIIYVSMKHIFQKKIRGGVEKNLPAELYVWNMSLR